MGLGEELSLELAVFGELVAPVFIVLRCRGGCLFGGDHDGGCRVWSACG